MSLILEKRTIERARDSLSFRTQAFIDGHFVPAISGKTFATQNPATSKPLAEIAECSHEDVDRAVCSARNAFEKGSWSRRSPAERKRVLLKCAELFEKHDAEF